MDEKEKNYKSSEGSEDFSQDSEQNKKNERIAAFLAWWYSIVKLVFGKDKDDVSDRITIAFGILSVLVVFFLLLFVVSMSLKGVRFYDYF